jgi:hypothetical protein
MRSSFVFGARSRHTPTVRRAVEGCRLVSVRSASRAGSPRLGASHLLLHLLCPALLLAVGLRVAVAHVPFGADIYDEGLIANGAVLVLRGQWPAVDFYAPYPPAAFAALALIFQLWGVRLIVERWFAAVLAALVSVLGFWLIAGLPTGSKSSPHRTWWTAGLACLAIAFLLGSRWVTPVSSGALALLLATGLGLRMALPRGRPAAACFCGALAGATALWRLDFGLYVLVANGVVWTLCSGHAQKDPLRGRRWAPGILAMSLGALAVSGVPLAWLVAHGGRRAFESLFWWPLAGTVAAHLPWTRHWTAFLVPLTSVVLIAGAATRLPRDPVRTGMALWLLLVGVGFWVYAVGLANTAHLLPLRVVALLLGALAQTELFRSALPAGVTPHRQESIWWRRAADVAFLAFIAAPVFAPVREFARAQALPAARHTSLPGRRGAGVYAGPPEVGDYRRIMAYLDRNVSPRARLFCGARRHDLFLKSDNLAYFLSERESGTYYWCLDAGVTSTWPVQVEMVHELEASRVEVLLTRLAAPHPEANAGSRSSGVHLLDDYLRRHYRLVAAWENYQIYRRRPSAFGAARCTEHGVRSAQLRRKAEWPVARPTSSS